VVVVLPLAVGNETHGQLLEVLAVLQPLVFGKVGVGKSSLLAALLGELMPKGAPTEQFTVSNILLSQLSCMLLWWWLCCLCRFEVRLTLLERGWGLARAACWAALLGELLGS
jgi:hypothetical protein